MDTLLVKVAKVPGTVKEVALAEGATLADAIKESGFETTGYQVRRDGENEALTSMVEDGDVITLVASVKGG